MHSRNLFAVPALLLLLSMCTPPAYDPPSELWLTVEYSNTQLATTATLRAKEIPTATPTITITPTSSIREVTPCGAAICEIEPDEIVLSRLCTVEVRGMGRHKDAACMSVISTVYERIRQGKYTDGSVKGTLRFGCGPYTVECQLPAYAANGCDGIIPQACPLNYPVDMAYFVGVARRYIEGERARDGCYGALYYGSRHGVDDKADACVIFALNGQWIAWYN